MPPLTAHFSIRTNSPSSLPFFFAIVNYMVSLPFSSFPIFFSPVLEQLLTKNLYVSLLYLKVINYLGPLATLADIIIIDLYSR